MCDSMDFSKNQFYKHAYKADLMKNKGVYKLQEYVTHPAIMAGINSTNASADQSPATPTHSLFKSIFSSESVGRRWAISILLSRTEDSDASADMMRSAGGVGYACFPKKI